MNKIAELRKQKGVTQTTLAKLLSVTAPNISAWENGRWQPNIADIVKMCAYFKCTSDYLLGIDTSLKGYQPSDLPQQAANLWDDLTELQQREIVGVMRGMKMVKVQKGKHKTP